jgi:hypothetical protein
MNSFEDQAQIIRSSFHLPTQSERYDFLTRFIREKKIGISMSCVHPLSNACSPSLIHVSVGEYSSFDKSDPPATRRDEPKLRCYERSDRPRLSDNKTAITNIHNLESGSIAGNYD